MTEFEKMNLESENLVDDRLAKLKELMPEVFSESGIDFDKLRLELGDEVDEGQERYAFTWPGKMDAIRQSQLTSEATLRPCVEKSRGRDGEDGSFDSDNIYIEGDNLEVLKLLQRGYHGKVKMIYIDPPYNTGHDFVYKDKFGDSIENYKEQAGLAGQSNAETSGRFHSDWCSMMYPRLRLARELLSDDGVIFISIDDNEQGNLRKLCDEVYGENNYLTCISRATGTPTGGGFEGLVNELDYLFVYAKNSSRTIINGLPMSEEDSKIYDQEDEFGRYLTRSLRRTGGEDRREDRPTMFFPITAPDGSAVYPKGPTGYDSRWICSPGTVERLKENHLLAWKKTVRNGVETWHPYQKFYLENRTKAPGNLWTSIEGNKKATRDIRDLFDKTKVFDFPKPVSLIEKALRIGSGQNDIVMDFFSGSATTAHALFRLNSDDQKRRTFILVQIPESCLDSSEASRAGYATLCDVGEERIRRAGDKIKAELEESNRQLKFGEEPKKLPDIGFRVFTLDDSGIDKPKPGELTLEVVKPDRSDMDIIFEMMLKWGLELTLPIEREEAAGYPIYSVACGELVCCLADGLTIEALEAIADIEPRRVLMLDSILTDSLKLNAAQIFKRVGEKTGREVELRTV